MPVQHILYEENWALNNETYKTKDAILNEVPYKPEILFLGTFNPAQPGNKPEFFYGRNYFWPVLFNLMRYKKFHYNDRRDKKGQPIPQPTLLEILKFCNDFKIVFGDMITQVLHTKNSVVTWKKSSGRGRPCQKMIYLGKMFNLIQDYTKTNDKGIITYGLNELEEKQIDWNTDRVIFFVKETITIKTVYITCNPKGNFKERWDIIRNYNYGRKIDFRRIFTPSGQGSKVGVPTMKYIIRHWLGKYDFKKDYEGLNMDWVKQFLSENEIKTLRS